MDRRRRPLGRAGGAGAWPHRCPNGAPPAGPRNRPREPPRAAAARAGAGWAFGMPVPFRLPDFRPAVFRDRPAPAYRGRRWPMTSPLDYQPPNTQPFDHRAGRATSRSEPRIGDRPMQPRRRPRGQPQLGPRRLRARAASKARCRCRRPAGGFRRCRCCTRRRARADAGPTHEALEGNARLLIKVLADYGVKGTIVELPARPGGDAVRTGAGAGDSQRPRDRPRRRRGAQPVGDRGAHRHRAGPQRDRHRGAERQTRHRVSERDPLQRGGPQALRPAADRTGQEHRRPGGGRPT